MLKALAVWAFVKSHVIPLVILAAASLLIFQSCRDKKDSVEEIQQKERIRVKDSAIAALTTSLVDRDRELGLALANGTKIVDRWHESAPQPIRTGSSRDTITQLAQQVRACRQVGDSLVQSVVEIRTSCTAYRDTASRLIGDLKSGIAHRDTLLSLKTREKRVQSYADGLYDALNRRPVFRVGTTTKLLFGIHGKLEAEYAIPSAVKSESGDGLRILAGGQIRF